MKMHLWYRERNLSRTTNVVTTKTEVMAFKGNAITVKKKDIMPEIVQGKRKMNPVRPVKPVVLLVVQKNIQHRKKH